MNSKFLLICIGSLLFFNCSSKSQNEVAYKSPTGDCEWCGAGDAPAELSYKTSIAPDDEPGKKLLVSGYVYRPDGKTPAEGILVYVYHTNIEGVYPKKGDETDNARRHGYLRGWMVTDPNGYYEFETIKPEPYPSRSEPAHIHYTITGPDFEEYWIKSLLFEGDSLIKEEDLLMDERSGGSIRITVLTEKDGWLKGNRDIVLNRSLMENP